MIPYNTITAWGVTHPWITREQVEQDLLLSKAIIDIYTTLVPTLNYFQVVPHLRCKLKMCGITLLKIVIPQS